LHRRHIGIDFRPREPSGVTFDRRTFALAVSFLRTLTVQTHYRESGKKSENENAAIMSNDCGILLH
jgi:hypothetical protein